MRRLFLSLLWCGALAFAQNPEAGRVERNGDQATLIVECPRPVDSAAITLAQEFGIRVNVEDPPYVYSVRSDGIPTDIHGVVRKLAETANAQFPFGYRFDVDGNWFTLVPTHTRDRLG